MVRRQGNMGARAWLPLGCFVVLASCNHFRKISADVVLDVFNEGGVDSVMDGNLTEAEIAQERVVFLARRSLSRGFFSQGLAPGSDGAAAWYRDSAIRLKVDEYLNALGSYSAYLRAHCISADGVVTGDPKEEHERLATGFYEAILRRLDELTPGSKPAPSDVCVGTQVSGAGRRVADAIEFTKALETAVQGVAKMVDEGLLTVAQGQSGLRVAMDEASLHIASRRWRKSARMPALGVAIKGGASSGPYSAGATWRALTLMHRYAAWKQAQGKLGVDEDSVRFSIASGTSAGAVVAAAVDIFQQDECVIDPEARVFRSLLGQRTSAKGLDCMEYGRRIMATVFTCTNQDSLYCIDRKPIWELAGSQKGLMDFTGLRALMERHFREQTMSNSMELLLTTVDFRWGNLYLQSDQDPTTAPLHNLAFGVQYVRRNIEASFVLPFIAHPVEELWIHGRPRTGVFLDGGIKSEIPILALEQSGIERALVIGSSPTRITPVQAPENAAEIAARYLDVSLSAVTENEWDGVGPAASFHRGQFARACKVAKDALGYALSDRFCAGEYARACGDTQAPSRSFNALGIFRPESVEGSFGYSFDATQMRRLFEAGAEAIRARCAEVASFLGMSDVTPALLDQWCNETPISEDALCRVDKERAQACE